MLVHAVPFAYGSSIAEWLETLRKLRQLEAGIIVPGHGPVMRDTAYLDVVISLFESLIGQVSSTLSVQPGSSYGVRNAGRASSP
jgi:glyoxylase-like metal-dependent hydrolase (beta-lactamase superfamily II)